MRQSGMRWAGLGRVAGRSRRGVGLSMHSWQVVADALAPGPAGLGNREPRFIFHWAPDGGATRGYEGLRQRDRKGKVVYDSRPKKSGPRFEDLAGNLCCFHAVGAQEIPRARVFLGCISPRHGLAPINIRPQTWRRAWLWARTLARRWVSESRP